MKESAFFLHQVTERFYAVILLVFSQYKSRTHGLNKLEKLPNEYDLRLLTIFPRKTEEEKRLFNLLLRARARIRYHFLAPLFSWRSRRPA